MTEEQKQYRREYLREYRREWAKRNPDKIREYRKNRLIRIALDDIFADSPVVVETNRRQKKNKGAEK